MDEREESAVIGPVAREPKTPEELEATSRHLKRRFVAITFLMLGIVFALLPMLAGDYHFFTARTVLDRKLAFEIVDSLALGLVGALAAAFAVPLAPPRTRLRRVNAIFFGLTIAASAITSPLTGLCMLIVGMFLIWIGRYLTAPGIVALTVALIIWAAVSDPGETSWTVRAMVARTRSDMRTLATALESYYANHGEYPESTSDPARKALWDSREVMPTFARSLFTSQTLPNASEPADLLIDSFRLLKDRRTFAYWVPPSREGWILISPGPDGDFQITSQTLPSLYVPNEIEPRGSLIELTYDPTNGQRSRGDIYRTKE